MLTTILTIFFARQCRYIKLFPESDSEEDIEPVGIGSNGAYGSGSTTPQHDPNGTGDADSQSSGGTEQGSGDRASERGTPETHQTDAPADDEDDREGGTSDGEGCGEDSSGGSEV